MTKVVKFHKLGEPEVLKVEDWEAPELQKGEILMDVAAFALNREDILFFQGLHHTLPTLPSRLGSEGCGTIVAVGEGVERFAVGDRVLTTPFANVRYGMHGEQAIVRQEFLTLWPEELSAVEATSVWMQYLTAYYPLVAIGASQPGDFILVTAASSSAGIGAIEIAKDTGATVIATTRSGAKTDAILNAGAHHVIAMEKEDVAKRIIEITEGKGVRVIYDAVGGSLYDRYTDALAEDAIVFLYGLLDGEPAKVDVVKMVRKNAVIYPYSMFNEVRHPDRLEAGIAYILDRLKDGRLKPRIADEVFTRIRAQVDARIGKYVPGTIEKFASVHDNLRSMNPEDWSNAAHSCRRILKELADKLFPPQSEVRVKQAGNKTQPIKLGEEQYINRLITFVEEKSGSQRFREIVGSHLDFLGNRLDSICQGAHKGTHSTIIKMEEADRIVIYTYMILGDILYLIEDTSSSK